MNFKVSANKYLNFILEKKKFLISIDWEREREIEGGQKKEISRERKKEREKEREWEREREREGRDCESLIMQ